MEHAFEKLDGLQRPIPDIKKLLTLAPALKSIVTHPPAQHTH
jgi:hypothetical protein